MADNNEDINSPLHVKVYALYAKEGKESTPLWNAFISNYKKLLIALIENMAVEATKMQKMQKVINHINALLESSANRTIILSDNVDYIFFQTANSGFDGTKSPFIENKELFGDLIDSHRILIDKLATLSPFVTESKYRTFELESVRNNIAYFNIITTKLIRWFMSHVAKSSDAGTYEADFTDVMN